MTRFYLIRHGETEWNSDGNRYCGRSDIVLSDKGEDQVREAARLMSGTRLDAVYSSPLIRAVRTAERIAESRGLNVITDDRLTEMDFGAWEGLRPPEIQGSYLENWNSWNERPDHVRIGMTGETALEASDRLIDFFQEIALNSPDARIAVAGHSTVYRLFLARILGMPLSRYRQIHVYNAGITTLQCDGRRVELVQLNAGPIR
ncbi:histidine phosphatase family protein [Paenibacillus dakarensis]|uniref:histidine phosphatase family protein n=1 Tax=Paenibacillus dakarensis TaxID=1527293 RepID=UPI0006D548A2|nr:histidine phosphatase family protein [Paenibacillus dakarensis]